MTKPQFFSYPKYGEVIGDLFHYSQSARVGDRIEISGQGTCRDALVSRSRKSAANTMCPGGWDPISGGLRADPMEEADQAFENVQLALTDAGGKGWSQVYSVKVYVLEKHWNDQPFIGRLVENLKKWAPHKPLLSVIGVTNLGSGPIAGMRVEIEVVAHDPEGARSKA